MKDTRKERNYETMQRTLFSRILFATTVIGIVAVARMYDGTLLHLLDKLTHSLK